MIKSASGFSLVELSIVLVILGLLTGGILTGQNLIRAAELRSVVTEFQRYHSAVQTFREKYFALPGDMPNATDFWGAADISGTCATAAGTGSQTCNGNGNGKVLRTNYTAGHYQESLTFWQHLSNAGFIEGGYSGKSGAASITDYIPGENVPRSKIGSASWTTVTFDYSSNTEIFSKNFEGFFSLSNYIYGATNVDSPILNPEEAWNIDKKTDDGMPGQGRVIAHHWDDCTDATSSTDFEAAYLLGNSAILCSLKFIKVY